MFGLAECKPEGPSSYVRVPTTPWVEQRPEAIWNRAAEAVALGQQVLYVHAEVPDTLEQGLWPVGDHIAFGDAIPDGKHVVFFVCLPLELTPDALQWMQALIK